MKKTVLVALCTVFLVSDAWAAPSKPIVCGGNRTITVKNRKISTAGTAVRVSDNCTVTLINCTIIAGVALDVSDNGTVIVRNSDIEGRKRVVSVRNNATVKAKSSAFYGRVRRQDNGEFKRTRTRVMARRKATTANRRAAVSAHGTRVEGGAVDAPGVRVRGGNVDAPGVRVRGGNVDAPGVRVRGGNVDAPGVRVRGGSTMEVSPKVLRRSGAIRCRGNQDITVRKKFIKTKGSAVVVSGNCDVTIVDSHIDAGGYGIEARGNGDVRVVRSFIKGRRGAVLVGGQGDVTAKKSNFRGGIKKKGMGDFNNKGGNSLQ